MIRTLQERPAVRRSVALLLLGAALWIVLPPMLAPVEAWRDAHAALTTEREITDRQARLAARRGAVAALAAGQDVPFLVAADAASATSALVARVSAAAPADAMRLQIEPPADPGTRPGAPVSLRFGFEATEGGLQAFLVDIEGRRPFLRLDEMTAVPNLGVDGSITLAGSATVSAVPLLRAAP